MLTRLALIYCWSWNIIYITTNSLLSWNEWLGDSNACILACFMILLINTFLKRLLITFCNRILFLGHLLGLKIIEDWDVLWSFLINQSAF